MILTYILVSTTYIVLLCWTHAENWLQAIPALPPNSWLDRRLLQPSLFQKELDYGGDDAAVSPRLHFQHQFPQSTPHLTNSSIPTSTGFVGQLAHGVPPRTSHLEQVKNSVFSNAFSSPFRRSLQPYHLAQEEGPCGLWGTRSNDVNSLIDYRECDSPNRPNDSSMEH